MTTDVTDSNTDAPAGLRKTVNRVSRQNDRLTAQNERLIKMVLFQRFKDGNFDFAEGEYLLEHFRPQVDDIRDYADKFTTDALRAWLIGSRS
jgi:hypothetical protein